MKVIVDTDIASAFAKINKLDLLIQLFQGREVVITTEIYQELLVPLDYGFTFPLKIFSKFRTIRLEGEEVAAFEQALLESPNLGKGELEAITICQKRGYAFSAIDYQAIRFAESKGITVFPLDVVLRLLWEMKILSKAQVRKLIDNLEEKNGLEIKEQNRIFAS